MPLGKRRLWLLVSISNSFVQSMQVHFSSLLISRSLSAGSEKVTIIAHSAGGWLGRVYMADFGTDDIALFLSLGSPHLYVPLLN